MKTKRYRLDINCDLGEGEPISRTRALMRFVTSANVACGGHAGSAKSMMTCVNLVKSMRVRLGAHPGFFDRKSFGRAVLPIGGDQLELLLLQQVGALEKIASQRKVKLHHIKLHGGLYQAVEKNPVLARHYLSIVQRYWPGVILYALAGGMVQRVARRSGIEVWREAFADRAYRADGSLVPRGQAGAVLAGAEAAVKQVREIVRRADVKTICVHGDTPHAVRIARMLRAFVSFV